MNVKSALLFSGICVKVSHPALLIDTYPPAPDSLITSPKPTPQPAAAAAGLQAWGPAAVGAASRFGPSGCRATLPCGRNDTTRGRQRHRQGVRVSGDASSDALVQLGEGEFVVLPTSERQTS